MEFSQAPVAAAQFAGPKAGTGEQRIALFVDADNVAHTHIDQVLVSLALQGRIVLRHVHGNWSNGSLNGWRGELERHALRPIQQFGYVPGKNGADTAMIVDAMDAFHAGSADAFALVTGDSDFTPLAVRLRGAGCNVFGFGGPQTPAPLRLACTRFEQLRSAAAPDRLTLALASSVAAFADQKGWAPLSRVAGKLHELGIRSPDWGHKKLGELLKASALVDMQKLKGGADWQVRWRGSYPPAGTTGQKKRG